MNWLTEIFSDNSDKARFIAILVSSIVALGLLLLNQRFINKREKTKLLIDKADELYKSVLSLEKHGTRYLSDIGVPSNPEEESQEKERHMAVDEAIYNIGMIGTLYFSEFSEFNDRDLESEIHPLKMKMIKLNSADSAGKEDYDPIYSDFEKIIKELKSGCKKISKKYKY